MDEMKKPAVLALEDGSVFRGFSCGAQGESSGELVFNTSMMGYQEVLTDPSYKGQLVVMTYPQIGNYGITAADYESARPFLEGFVVWELCRHPSNWESVETVDFFLKRNGTPGIEGVDTRALTIRLRQAGSLRAVLSSVDLDAERLIRKARQCPPMSGQNLAKAVSCSKPYEWTGRRDGQRSAGSRTRGHHVIVFDFGVKRGILRCLGSLGCRVSVVPAWTSAAEALALRPDGIVLSNGPGDPEPLSDVAKEIRRLVETGLPTLGICLGHQLLGLAFGGRTFKLKFGHHGSNHPVQDLRTGRIEITSQNHGFCVDMQSLPADLETTHINLNDRTSEGMRHRSLPIFSVQYHPEASAGPHDSRYIFERFAQAMARREGGRKAHA